MRKNKGVSIIALLLIIVFILLIIGSAIYIVITGKVFSIYMGIQRNIQAINDKKELKNIIKTYTNKYDQLDLNKFDENLPEGYVGASGLYTKGDNTYIIDEKGDIRLKEKEIRKVITEDDKEFSYWKTNGKGTILYYDIPSDEEIPETLIIPYRIGKETIKKIGDGAFAGVDVKRNENGQAIIVKDKKNNETLQFI